jgi:hypothetical protein
MKYTITLNGHTLTLENIQYVESGNISQVFTLKLKSASGGTFSTKVDFYYSSTMNDCEQIEF